MTDLFKNIVNNLTLAVDSAVRCSSITAGRQDNPLELVKSGYNAVGDIANLPSAGAAGADHADLHLDIALLQEAIDEVNNNNWLNDARGGSGSSGLC